MSVEEIKVWRVYYADGEFARQLGDPLLGYVESATREEAERKGANLPEIAGPGVWVVEDERLTAALAERLKEQGR